MARCRIRPPTTMSPISTFTTSQPRSLLSIARSNMARSRSLPSRSSQNRTAQTCCGLSARLAPSFRPAFLADVSSYRGRIPSAPFDVLPRPKAAVGRTGDRSCTRAPGRWPNVRYRAQRDADRYSRLSAPAHGFIAAVNAMPQWSSWRRPLFCPKQTARATVKAHPGMQFADKSRFRYKRKSEFKRSGENVGMTTIKDVAQHAGVSVATVSHVMNNSRAVSTEARDKVHAAIVALKYRRDGRSGRTMGQARRRRQRRKAEVAGAQVSTRPPKSLCLFLLCSVLISSDAVAR